MTQTFLGIDTSNYTTSCALYDPAGGVTQRRQLLPVKEGARGLRQSDAVFHHTVQLPVLLESLLEEDHGPICAVGVSDAPRRQAGSYMPCFLAGVNAASAVSAAMRIPLIRVSHQQGHVAAAAYSAGQLALLGQPFLAFHVSGGTTDALLVRPSREEIIGSELLASSLDLKAGQAVDRVGVMLGFPFPAGKFVDACALQSRKQFTIRVKLKDGNCSLSGVENQCRAMMERGEPKEDICRYCLDYIRAALAAMTEYQLGRLGRLPILFAGGVMSSITIRETLTAQFGALFAEPDFSCDNAAGVALLAAMKTERR